MSRPPLTALVGSIAVGAMLIGLAAGLRRLGYAAAPLEASLVHGPLMVCGAFGTLIGLERAAGAKVNWGWLAPGLSAASAVLALMGWRPMPAGVAAVGAAWVLAALYLRSWRAMEWRVGALNVGSAVAFAAGAAGWAWGRPFAWVGPLWATFLVLTVAAERLEMARYAPPVRWASALLAGSLGALGLGLVDSARGWHGAGWAGAAVALAALDPARRMVRSPGQARFASVAVLSAYGWLAVAGLLSVGPGVWWVGGRYDAALHAVFVGFVMPMVLAHAPLVVGLVTGREVPFSRAMYLPFLLLQGSLLARLAGDLLRDEGIRRLGALGNALVLPLLLVGLLAWRGRSARLVAAT